jgi:GAF domain-containing protein
VHSVPPALSAEQLMGLYASVSSRLRSFSGEADAAAAMTSVAVDMLPGAEFAGLTRQRPGGALITIGATDPLVHQIDRVQYELRSGPCVEALHSDRPVVATDLRTSRRWPEFGPVSAELGVRSMLSYRLHLEDDGREEGVHVLGGMNLYARRPRAFDVEEVQALLPVLAAFCALAIWGGSLAAQARSMETALSSSRDIGAAQGILMERYKVPREEAFGLLAVTSQRTNRKLRDVALHLVDTGEIPPQPPPR